jgi:hypothetical protein
MVDLVRELPQLRVHLFSGLVPGLLESALCDPDFTAGTVLTA